MKIIVCALLVGAVATGGLVAAHAAPAPKPRAFVIVAPYRYDDVLWENDRTAHRIYARPLEAHEPPSGSGIDAWGKKVRFPFMENQIKAGQHDEHGAGLDFYNVGTSRGDGGLGIWYDNKLWVSRNYRAVRILDPGPKRASFEVDYAPWPVDTVRTVSETRRFSLAMGTNFTRLVSTISSSTTGPLVVGIGLAKHPGSTLAKSELKADRAKGILSAWGPEETPGAMGVAVLVDPAMIADVTEDADNYLVLLNVKPGTPFVYYMGAGWDHSLDFKSRADWETYVFAQKGDFRAAK
jgi:Domain of unknown function (DUF4861)